MISLSASFNKKQSPSFGAIAPVSYVVVNGHTETDAKIIDEVTKQFIKQIREGKAEDIHLRQSLFKATGDSSLAQTYQTIKKMGKYLITGQDAINLKNIWSDSKMNLQTKTAKASDFVKKLFQKLPTEKLAIVAEKINIKGKVKYIIKNMHTTIY